MAVTLVGSGGIFTRLGRLFRGLADLNALQGGTATSTVAAGASWATRGTNIEADAADSPAVSDQIDGHWQSIDSWRSAQSSLFSSMQALAEAIVVRQVDLDANLPTKDLSTALKELIRQMKASGDDLADSAVAAGSQTAVGTPTGNAQVVVSVKNNDGWVLQTAFAETLRFTVSADAQSGGATARNETLSVQGRASNPDVSAYDWPYGSGANQAVSLADAHEDNSAGNLLYNGGFDTFNDTNYPQNWVVATGTVGTNVSAAGGAAAYTDGDALKITGDAGGTLTTLRQTFETDASTTSGSGGTPAELEPNTQYAVGLWVKRDNAQSAGALRVALVDGGHTVTTDVAGTSNSFSIDCTALTASYAFYSGTFRTPLALPTTGLKLELKLTTAIDDGDSVFIDDLAMTEMTQLYAGGPFVAAFPGDTDVILDDQWTVAITNTMGQMAMWLERFFGLRELGLQFSYDSAGAETVSDSLIV